MSEAVADAQFSVRWEMDFDATSPADAVMQAFGIHSDPQSMATVFYVVDNENGTEHQIDAELVDKFQQWTELDIEDVCFFDAFCAWMGGGTTVPANDLAEWWADNQGRWV